MSWKIYKVKYENEVLGAGDETEFDLPSNYIVNGIVSSDREGVTLILKPDPTVQPYYFVNGEGHLVNGQTNEIVQRYINIYPLTVEQPTFATQPDMPNGGNGGTINTFQPTTTGQNIITGYYNNINGVVDTNIRGVTRG